MEDSAALLLFLRGCRRWNQRKIPEPRCSTVRRCVWDEVEQRRGAPHRPEACGANGGRFPYRLWRSGGWAVLHSGKALWAFALHSSPYDRTTSTKGSLDLQNHLQQAKSDP